MEVPAEYPALRLNTLRWYRAKGEGPRSFLMGGRVVYRRRDIEAWFAAMEERTAVGGVA